MSYKDAIVGKKIICQSVKISSVSPNKDKMILNRKLKIDFTNKSKKRTGPFSKAFVDKCLVIHKPEEKGYVSEKDLISILNKQIYRVQGCDYEISFGKKMIRAERLSGECSYTDPKIKQKKSHEVKGYSSAHGGQEIYLYCNEYAICYVNRRLIPTPILQKMDKRFEVIKVN